MWINAGELERALGLPDPAAVRGGTSAQGRDVAIVDAASLYLGSTGARAPRYPPLRVRVVHGSMEQARYPVAAGRYKGIPIEGALGYLDDRFGGALHRLAPRPPVSRTTPAPAGTCGRPTTSTRSARSCSVSVTSARSHPICWPGPWSGEPATMRWPNDG